MSDRLTISAEPREITGKKAKQLRRDGLIPAVIYGRTDPVSIQLDNLALRHVLRSAGSTQLIDITLSDKTRTVLARDIQQHVTRGDLIHVDFYEVDMKVMVTSEVALVTVGQSAPAAEGLGVATLNMLSVQIEALPDDLISELEVDLSMIETMEDTIHVRDLQPPKGVTILEDPETVIASFQITREEPEEEDEDDLYAPSADSVEVIGRGSEDEDED